MASSTTRAGGPLVHCWQRSGVNECILIVFDASTKSSDGEAEMPEQKDAQRP